jgi:phosphatidylinositol alpha-1,6-mannosyltransferase
MDLFANSMDFPMTDRRKYLLITNDLGPHAGGIENFILGMLRTLIKSGFPGDQILIYTSWEKDYEEFDKKLSAELGVLVIRDKRKVLLPTTAITLRIARVMNLYQSTHLWFGAAAPMALSARYLKKRGAVRSVALTHGHEVWWSALPPFSWVMSRIGRSNDVITHLGDFTRQAIRNSVGEQVSMVQIAPGIDFEHFSPGSKDPSLIQKFGLENKKVILVVGRLVRRKGQDTLIKAMPEILASIPEAHLLIVGVGGYEKRLRRLTRNGKLESNVSFVGKVSYDQLPLYFRLADLFAMPARSRLAGLEVEGLGIVYLEAGATGKAVIAGASGGAPDAVKENETGYVVNGNKPDQLTEKIIYLLYHPEIAEQMGEAGRQWAISYWRWELWAERFSQLLQ